jgi:hypothetical protein
MRDLTLQSKRNVSMHGLQKRLEADEVVLQTPISVEEQEGSILPTGQMSREAMRKRKSGSHCQTFSGREREAQWGELRPPIVHCSAGSECTC